MSSYLLSPLIIHPQFIVDPHDAQTSVDLAKNNPLSQEEEVRLHVSERERERDVQTVAVPCCMYSTESMAPVLPG